MKRILLFALALVTGLGIYSKNAISSKEEPPPKLMENVSDYDPAERISQVAQRVSPAVVSIKAEHVGKPGRRFAREGRRLPRNFPEEGTPFGDFFSEFFEGMNRGGGEGPAERPQTAGGSGIIIDKRGYIVTNNHVVEGANKFTVDLSGDGSNEVPAKLVGADKRTDLAILKIEAKKDLAVAEWGDSDRAKVGARVVAIGSPFMLDHTVTQGIVSSKRRNTNNLIGPNYTYDLIQTDAAINPGNSGGPLCTLDGRIIGVNVAIFTQNGGSIGLGFAIPSNLARDVSEKLIKDGKVSRGRIGVFVENPRAELKEEMHLAGGALVHKVEPEGPAAKAGVKAGDVITEMNGSAVQDATQLRRNVSALAPGQTVKLKVISYQDGKQREVSVKLANLEDDKERGEETDSPEGESDSLGISLAPADGRGLIVERVAPGSPGHQFGLRRGDVVIKINRRDATLNNYQKAVRESRTLVLLVERDGGEMFVEIPLKK